MHNKEIAVFFRPEMVPAACACPVITRYATRILNDSWWADDAERTAVLGPLVALIAGTRSTSDVETRRWHIAVDSAARVAVPMALESASMRATPERATSLRGHAAALRALAPITDEATRRAANASLRAAADAAYDAADPAAAAAHAAGYAAANAADAAFGAYAYAADAADTTAAAYADARLAARRPVRDSAIETLRLMCESEMEQQREISDRRDDVRSGS